MRERLRAVLEETLIRCFEKGVLKETSLPDYVIEVPNHENHGHFATNLPMMLASSQGRRPTEIASIIVDHLTAQKGFIEKTDIAGPGFINFTISKEQWYGILSEVIARGKTYGQSDWGEGTRVLVEFVSANPTGPLHLGHGRGAALGDTLCRVLESTGFEVVREFYINDAGQQIRLLGESIYSRWRQGGDSGFPFPESGYHGEYITDLAKEISTAFDLSSMEPDEAITFCSNKGKASMLQDIKSDLELFRVHFDVWTSEQELLGGGLLQSSLEAIQNQGMIYEKDGAMWIETSAYGDDKDRVIRKKDGQYTYFASDIAYHLAKWNRGFSKAVNIWGADHHGYVQRVQAALQAKGIDPSWLSTLLLQLVKLWKGGKEIKMSKRAGSFVTLRDLIDEVGIDAVRFVFLSKSHDSPLDFDIDLVKKQDSDNPVYYVQYAHARICSVFRKAESEGITLPQVPAGLFERLLLEEELVLIRQISEFPALLKDIAGSFEPHRLTYYLTDLAASFHRYFNLGTRFSEHRIITEDKETTQARLLLAQGVRIVIRNGLHLLGIEAPEKM
jgi:arginyl-tRNA synthetase